MTAPGSGLVLAVDLGSGGPKVGYVTTTGEPVWWWHERGDALGGASAQDPRAWWDTVVAAARRGLASGVEASRVTGVAITGQWASTVPVDADGEPVAECLMWSSTAGARHSAARFGGPLSGYAPGVLARWLWLSGGAPSPTGSDPVSHMLHLQEDRPELADRIRWYLEPVDFLTMRFTGVPVASPASMTLAWLTDNRDPARIRYDGRLVTAAGVDPHRLPPLVPTGSVVGTVRPEVAELIGIPTSAQVVTGLPDLHTATLGSGSVRQGELHLSLGTSGWVSTPVPAKKTDVLRELVAVPGLDDGYLLADSQDNAGRCLEWFRETCAPDLDWPALAALAASAPAGAGGVLFTPWLTGERSPVADRRARAGFHNVSLATGRGDLVRAVLEGVALNTRWLLDATDRFTGGRFEPIRLIGGGARLDVWCQVLADACDRRLERVARPLLAGLRGAGLLVGRATGEVAAHEVRGLVPVDREFEPDGRHRAAYDDAYAELPGLYRRQRRFFARRNADRLR